MCGIAGVFTLNTKLNHKAIAEHIAGYLHHRGPDYSNTVQVNNHCSLAHTRLKIIDLSQNANQPMYCYQKRLVIVFNGEIYNYRQLKLELQRVEYGSKTPPYPFTTQSDTEVILAAYYRWGKDCVKYLDGMFAFAIFDVLNNELFAARDRQGKKPFYYIHQNDTFAFSSEIRPLLHTALTSKKLDIQQLYDYVQYQTTFSPHTLIKDVNILESAHTLTIKIHGEKIFTEKNRYWKPIESILTTDDVSYEEAKKQVRQLVFSAVEKRLVSDVSLGAFLSGGIDSSAIVGIMKQFFSSDVNTFHVTSDLKEFSEKEFADELANVYQTKHHNIVVDKDKIFRWTYDALERMDYPTGDGINTYIVSRATKDAGITVALSGLGGDELFAGYPQFKVITKLHQWSGLDIPFIRKNIFRYLPNQFFNHAYRLKILMQAESLYADKVFPYYRKLFSNNLPLSVSEKKSFLNTNEQYLYLLKNQHILSYISLMEMSNYMQHVLLRDADQMGMANALEIRAPFLDTQLVNFVLSLPDEYKYPSSPKKLLTDSLHDILPKDIVHRKKMGFVLPFQSWMRKELRSFCDEKIKQISGYSFMDGKKLLSLWNDYQQGKHHNWWMFWHLIVLQNWIEKNNVTAE